MKHTPEMMFLHGEPDRDLGLLMITMLHYIDEWKPTRSQNLFDAYQNEITIWGHTLLENDMHETLGNNQVGFMINKFPYDRFNQVLPDNKQLAHYCLWNAACNPLSKDEIIIQLNTHFPNQPSLVVVNGDNVRSINEFWHAHVLMIKDR